MSLAPGSRIGPYEILGAIGTGGMGVVYKARDVRLRRDVAIKTLNADGGDDTARRFLREAQTASALNHPNIVTIYDIGTTEESGPYIAMEYIAGTTLRDLLSRGRLDTRAVLDISVQLARALSRAHVASIIHRDLKPANVILGSDGTVKVLDFGLAKALQTATDGDGQTTRLSISGPLTIAGTIPYMSPEQVVGTVVDRRSDIFSFGVMLYEMVTARHPFAHDTRDATVSAILHWEVTFPEKARTRAGRALEAIIRKCLVKDRDQRCQSIDLVLQDLEAAQKLLAPTGRRAVVAAVLAAAAAVVIGVGVRRMTPAMPVSEQILLPVPVTSYEGDEIQPTLSPEGDRVAFSWNGERQDNFDIYAKLLDSGAPLRLTSDAADDSSPAWSPDGRSIAFLRGRAEQTGALLIVPALGGAERKVTDVYMPPAFFPGRALTWSPDGKWLVCGCDENRALMLIAADGGATRRLTRPNEFPGARGDTSPVFSADGAQLAFARFLGGPGEIFVVTLNDDFSPRGTVRQLTFDKRVAFGPAWLAGDDALLFVAGPSLSGLRFWRMAVAGGKAPVALGSLGDNVSNPVAVQPHGESGARVIYQRRSFDTNIWRLDIAAGASNRLTRLASSSADDNDPKVSPDGRTLMFNSNRTGSYGTWLADPDGRNAREVLGRGAGGARWSPDGTEIVFEWPESGRHIAIMKRDGTGQQRIAAIQDGVTPSFSRDGKWIYFASQQATSTPQVWKVGHPALEKRSSQPLQVTKRGGTYAEESSDGAYVYFTKSFSTGPIWKMPSAGGQEELVVDESVHWSNFTVVNDGIFFVAVPGTGRAASSELYGVPGNALRFFRFADRKTMTIYPLPHPVFMGLSVAPDRTSVFLTQVDHQGSDLMVVNGLR